MAIWCRCICTSSSAATRRSGCSRRWRTPPTVPLDLRSTPTALRRSETAPSAASRRQPSPTPLAICRIPIGPRRRQSPRLRQVSVYEPLLLPHEVRALAPWTVLTRRVVWSLGRGAGAPAEEGGAWAAGARHVFFKKSRCMPTAKAKGLDSNRRSSVGNVVSEMRLQVPSGRHGSSAFPHRHASIYFKKKRARQELCTEFHLHRWLGRYK